MKFSRRNLMATGLTALAASYSGIFDNFAFAQAALAGEDGSKLWLRVHAHRGRRRRKNIWRLRGAEIKVLGNSPTLKIAEEEINSAFKTLLSSKVEAKVVVARLLIGTWNNIQSDKGLGATANFKYPNLGPEGYVIQTKDNDIIIGSEGEIGVLYGVFHFLRLLQTRQSIDNLNIAEKPKVMLRQADPLGQSQRLHRSVATRASRSGTGPSCPTRFRRGMPSMPGRARRSA